MNLFLSLRNLLPFLDMVITPRSTPTPSPSLDQVIEPQTSTTPEASFTGLLLIVLVIFLIFVGCLIWKSLKQKK